LNHNEVIPILTSVRIKLNRTKKTKGCRVNINKLLQKQIFQDVYMLNQFKSNLLASIERLDTSDNQEKSITEIKEKLIEDSTWSEVNQVELALVDLYDDTTLLMEWQRRLSETHLLPEHLVSFYSQKNEITEITVIRPLLLRLITDLQWQRESKRVIRFNESRMRKNIVWLFLFSFLLFFTPTISRMLFGAEFDNLRLYYLFTAATAGILGAGFSQLTSIQARVVNATVEQVKAMSKLGYILARAMVGAGAGLIMFYLLQSGLLGGAFFPTFIQSADELIEVRKEAELIKVPESGNQSAESSAIETPIVELNLTDSSGNSDQLKEDSSKNHGVSQDIEVDYDIGTLSRPAQGLSLLIIWCLLAGFSEKLIPGILNNKAKKLTDSTA
jgi:hypothetical protein